MPGQYYDSQSGLFYNWNRYYNPAIGRYVSVDPIGLDGGLNTFNYVEASPVMYSDPEGLFAPAIAAGVRACLANPICRSIAIDIAKRTGKALADAAQAAMESWNGTTPIPQVCPPASAPGVDGPAGATGSEMAKGGRQSKENEWSRSARLEPDPCKWLKEQYNDPEISNIDKQKIKTAEKALGCRRNSSQK